MANEFVHGTVGTTMTQAEFEGVGLHVFNSQATGDILYASSTTQLSRLAKGTAGQTLITGDSNIPAWSSIFLATTNAPAINAGSGSVKIATTGGNAGLWITSTQDGAGGAGIRFAVVSASPAASDVLMDWQVVGRDSAGSDETYGRVQIRITSPTNGAETGDIIFKLINSGADNDVVTISGAGGLAVDADIGTGDDPVALFDEYDDALVLKQGIQQDNRELLTKIGVFERKDTGSGYMLKVQPMMRLLAGGIYQTRQLLEEKINCLEDKINRLSLPQGA